MVGMRKRGKKMDDDQKNGSVLILPEAYLKRRELEAKFTKFCQAKSGNDVDKLKLFVFAELAMLHLQMEKKNE